MNPLTLLYGAVSGARNLAYDTGWFTARLQGPVVSVGNISVGGTGKTPFIIYLGEQLKQCGIKFDVLSRGYGRGSKGVRVVDPAGSAREFGDEPLLIARKLGVPVILGESRYHAGLAAEQKFGAQLHLLDDGFQHRQLHRDLDIVLVGEGDLEDKLLPAGRLREPASSLKRADVVVMAGESKINTHPSAALRTGSGVPTLFKVISLDAKPAGGVVAFCGIARPQGFFAGLREAGVKVMAERIFRDHHAYSGAEVRELEALRVSSGAVGFVTTEKDLINLEGLGAKLSTVSIAKLSVSVDRPEELLGQVVQLVTASKATKS